MSFDIKEKVALITGGASGIGLRFAVELLENGLKGVALADINPEFGEKALEEISSKFGPNKAIFIQTDVTNLQSFEESFKKTIAEFKNIDILINNAGILNDAIWEKEIAINVNGVVHGMLLGLENYIPKYKSGPEGVIINISSIAGVKEFGVYPVYTGTKFAILGLSKAWGDEVHYQRTKVRVIALCPGITDTPLVSEMSGKSLGPAYEEFLMKSQDDVLTQTPESVALAMVKIIKNAKPGTVWVAEGGEAPYEFILPPRESFIPK